MSEPTISVCALMPYPCDTAPSQRFRLEQWLPYLKGQGINVDLFPFADDNLMRLIHEPGKRLQKAVAITARLARRVRDVARIPRYDVVLIHRSASLAGPALLERALPLFGRPLIFDFDDAIFLLHATEANRRTAWLKFPGKTATICRLSDHIVAGNSFLADYARRYNSRVSIIPSSVDITRFQPRKKHGSNQPIILGWAGSSTSQTYLEMFAPVLADLVSLHNVELRVLSDREPKLGGIPFVWRRWSAETEVEEIADFDIGIMPMPDDEWARGKCAMKALLYMSLAVPAVCSAVGANCDVIRHGENGLLAMNREEWVANIDSLVKSPALRKRLGEAGRVTVEEHYSTERCAAAFGRIVRETVEERRARYNVIWNQQKSKSGAR